MNCQTLKDKLLVQDMNGFQRILPPGILHLLTLKLLTRLKILQRPPDNLVDRLE